MPGASWLPGIGEHSKSISGLHTYACTLALIHTDTLETSNTYTHTLAKKNFPEPRVVTDICNPSNGKPEAGRSRVWY